MLIGDHDSIQRPSPSPTFFSLSVANSGLELVNPALTGSTFDETCASNNVYGELKAIKPEGGQRNQEVNAFGSFSLRGDPHRGVKVWMMFYLHHIIKSCDPFHLIGSYKVNRLLSSYRPL